MVGFKPGLLAKNGAANTALGRRRVIAEAGALDVVAAHVSKTKVCTVHLGRDDASAGRDLAESPALNPDVDKTRALAYRRDR